MSRRQRKKQKLQQKKTLYLREIQTDRTGHIRGAFIYRKT